MGDTFLRAPAPIFDPNIPPYDGLFYDENIDYPPDLFLGLTPGILLFGEGMREGLLLRVTSDLTILSLLSVSVRYFDSRFEVYGYGSSFVIASTPPK